MLQHIEKKIRVVDTQTVNRAGLYDMTLHLFDLFYVNFCVCGQQQHGKCFKAKFIHAPV